MKAFIDLYKNSENLHHAYFFVEHDVDKFFNELKKFFEETLGVLTSGNPDFWHGVFGTLTVDDAKAITSNSARKDFSGGRKVFVIQAEFITEEAQNALLKVFEEPTPGTHFFIISPQDMLLPTLRSRMMIMGGGEREIKTESILALSLAERLTRVKKVVDAISDEESTKQDAIILLNQIEKELYVLGTEKKGRELKICAEARNALYDRGAPVKMILEHVMLSV